MSVLLTIPAASEAMQTLVQGPAGQIECLFTLPKQPAKGGVVVCHPHPLYGGAMSNKVTYALASSAAKAGFVALRFNFRGVGASQGQHDNARGETDDAVLLAEALRSALPAGLPLVMAGFSFGAYVALSAASRVGAAALMSVAPPFGRYVGGPTPPAAPGCPWRVIHSQDDEVVSYADTVAQLQHYSPPPELLTVEGAGHFFHGRLADVNAALLGLLRALA